MLRMRGRARPLMLRKLAAPPSPGKLPTGPVSRDRRASETAHTPQSRHTPPACCLPRVTARWAASNQAREAWRKALRLNPAYSLEHRRNVLPCKNLADSDLVIEGRRAGIEQ
jgi:hypothetical protein